MDDISNYEIRVIPKKDNSGNVYWTAFFPEIVGCIGGGNSAEEAIRDAEENLKVYLDYLFRGNEKRLTKVQTMVKRRGDAIRQMSDEELAHLFWQISLWRKPATYNTVDGFCLDDGVIKEKEWLEWLKQEVPNAELD